MQALVSSGALFGLDEDCLGASTSKPEYLLPYSGLLIRRVY